MQSVTIAVWRSRLIVAPVLALVFSAVSAGAQMAPTRTWEELKQETQRRVDKNLGPVGGVKSEDAREALSNIHSLDRDEWAAAWSAMGERYDKRAQSEEAAKNNDAARDDYFWAFRYYTVARWPVPNSAGKQKAYLAALEAFKNYGKFLDPPVEIINVPFEGKSIRGYIRLPKDVRPAPMVLMINGTDSRKEDEVQGHDGFYRSGIGVVAIDMPGTGESPVKADVGSEHIFSRLLDYLSTRPDVDSKRIVAWGVSYGGHWSAQLAYEERARLRGAVVQGGPIDEVLLGGLAEEESWHAGIPLRPVRGSCCDLRCRIARRILRLWAAALAQKAGLTGAAFGTHADSQRRKRFAGPYF